MLPAYISAGFEAVHEFDRAVMLNQHAVGQVSNTRTIAVRNSLDRQHKQILLALESCRVDCLFAEMQVFADLVAKLGQRLVIGQRKVCHTEIISYDDSNFILYRFTIY